MGCAKSKESRCKHCHRALSPTRRSYSVPGLTRFHNKRDGYRGVSRSRSHNRANGSDSHSPGCDDQHIVSINSRTLGIMKTDLLNVDQNPPNDNTYQEHYRKWLNDHHNKKLIDSPGEVIQDKIIDEKKNVKTLTRTCTEEPETINAWELMEGLEDNTTPIHGQLNVIDKCLSFQRNSYSTPSLNPSISLQGRSMGESPINPGWLQIPNDSDSNMKSIISDFDPEIISTFRKALEELSPRTALNLKTPGIERKSSLNCNELISSNSLPSKTFPRGDNKVVLYFTTLRGVRKTYEDCLSVRVILKGMGLRVDERDVSMHYGFREELSELLGGRFGGGLPKVFVKGRYIGGAEEVQRMHEDGDLEKVFKGCEVMEDDDGVCKMCGDGRFVPCDKCSGSCKVFVEGGEEDENEEEGGFYRCNDCNENGIVRCPGCCY